MKLATLVSPIALAAALMFTGSAFAMTNADADAATTGAMAGEASINGVVISPEDLPKVQSQCNALVAKTTAAITGDDSTDPNVANAETTTDSPNPDAASTDSDAVSGIDQATTNIDLAALTLEDCRAAGLVEEGEAIEPAADTPTAQ